MFSIECQNHFDWQTVSLMHSFKKAQQLGPITRLLNCTNDEKKNYRGMNLAPTLKVPSMSRHPRTGDWYPAINKPARITHWLEHGKNVENVDWIVILYADMIIRGPIIPWELGALLSHRNIWFYLSEGCSWEVTVTKIVNNMKRLRSSPQCDLDSNAGTVMLPLIAAVTAAGGNASYVIDGVLRMRERPIGDLVTGLKQLGTDVNDFLGTNCPPVRVNGNGGLPGGKMKLFESKSILDSFAYGNCYCRGCT